MSVAYAADSQPFIVSLLDAPEVRIEVSGDEVSLFDMAEGFLAQSAKFNSVPNHWQAFALSRRVSARHHSPAASQLYNEDPILEFQECALHVGARVTFVGELRRKENGVLTVHPWEESSRKISRKPLSTPAPAAEAFSGKVFASNKEALIVLPQNRGMLAKLWTNLPSCRACARRWSSERPRERLLTTISDDANPGNDSNAASLVTSLRYARDWLAIKRPQQVSR